MSKLPSDFQNCRQNCHIAIRVRCARISPPGRFCGDWWRSDGRTSRSLFNRRSGAVTECYIVLQSVTECYRVLQSVTGCYRVLHRTSRPLFNHRSGAVTIYASSPRTCNNHSPFIKPRSHLSDSSVPLDVRTSPVSNSHSR